MPLFSVGKQRCFSVQASCCFGLLVKKVLRVQPSKVPKPKTAMHCAKERVAVCLKGSKALMISKKVSIKEVYQKRRIDEKCRFKCRV